MPRKVAYSYKQKGDLVLLKRDRELAERKKLNKMFLKRITKTKYAKEKWHTPTKEGDLVLLLRETENKYQAPYGPYKIIKGE